MLAGCPRSRRLGQKLDNHGMHQNGQCLWVLRMLELGPSGGMFLPVVQAGLLSEGNKECRMENADLQGKLSLLQKDVSAAEDEKIAVQQAAQEKLTRLGQLEGGCFASPAASVDPTSCIFP